MSRVYISRELAGSGRQQTYTGDNLREVALPLGGIGAGCLYMGGPVGAPHIFDQGRYGNGVLDAGHESLPRMESAKFTGEFPFARAGRTLTLEIG